MFKENGSSCKQRKSNSTDECLICALDKTIHASFLSYFLPVDPLCLKCRKQFKIVNQSIELDGFLIYGLYEYNDYFSSCLIQYKECMDEALYSIFIFPFLDALRKKYKNCIFVEVPSTNHQYEYRGFHHVQKLFSLLSIPCLDIFEKRETTQKNKTKIERKKISLFISIKKDIDLRNSNIVLIDDVCTTGETLKSCFHLLKDKTAHLEALVLAIHPLLLSEFVDGKSLK